MLAYGRRADPGLLVPTNAGGCTGVGQEFQGALPWLEQRGAYWLSSANSSSAGERKNQAGEGSCQVQTMGAGLLSSPLGNGRQPRTSPRTQ